VELGGGPIGTLDLYAASPRGWDDTEIIASRAYAGIVASLLLAAAKAELSGAWPTSSRPRLTPAA
jgi:hypothetical protein